MIKLSKLNGVELVVNCEQIESVEESPDTTITMINGRKILVLESADDIIDKTLEYKRRIFHGLEEK